VSQLARADDRWDLRVPHRDLVKGVMETGNFSEENESGVRMQVKLPARHRRGDVEGKGADACCVDTGVAEAISALSRNLVPCLQRPI
jgi:hypothetical protein